MRVHWRRDIRRHAGAAPAAWRHTGSGDRVGRYFLRDALGIAAGINGYSRQTDVIAMANYAQTVNVIGAIKTSKAAAVLDSTGEALVMYRRHFGTIPVEITAGDDMAYNEPSQASAVRFVETRLSGVQETLELAPASATIFRIPVR